MWGKHKETHGSLPCSCPPMGPTGCLGPREAWPRRTGHLRTPLPVAHTAEDHGGHDAEGEGVQHVGQQHLPLPVQAVLALLVTDSSQHRNWARKAGCRTVSHHTAEGGRPSPS